MRRTIHGGFANHTYYQAFDYIDYLSPEVQDKFHRWNERSEQMQVWTENALRAVIEKRADAYHTALEKFAPE